MKRVLSLLLIITLLLTFTGCDNSNTSSLPADAREVIVKMPVDDSVNGYRTTSDQSNSESSGMPDTLGAEEVSVYSSVISESDSSNSTGSFCSNPKTKVFHKSTCSSVKTMKDENKVFTSDREELIKNGYSPCKRCNP